MEAAQEELSALKRTKEYEISKEKLIDREWRLDNLYWIQDQFGNEVQFVRNSSQKRLCDEEHQRNLILKARQIGFSTLIDIGLLDDCLFRKDTTAGIIDENLKKAREKLEKIAYAYERLPQLIRDHVPLIRDHAEELAFANGSSIMVGTSHRGGTLQRLHVSEYGKISVDKPDTAREIKTGALPAVHPPFGKIWNESTAHGTAGEFYDAVERAKKLMLAGQPLTAIDFKLHFFAWWQHKEYRLPQNMVIIPQEVLEYLLELKAKYGIEVDGQQAAWYAKTLSELGWDDMRSEYPSHLEEAFFNSIEGAFFKREMTKARLEKRVGGMIPHDPSYRVDTFWDIGEDCTSVGFAQTDGLRVRVIDYWEAEGESLQTAAVILDEKRIKRGFVYGTHYGPHDLEHKDWGDGSRTRKAQAADLGIIFKVVPRVSYKSDSIAAGRRLLNMTWIDQEHCGRFVDALDNYRKTWNKTLAQWMSEPLHNWASHPADGWQQYAMGLEPVKTKEDGHRRAPPPRSSAWGA